MSGTWTHVEVTSALVRASRAGQLADLHGILAVLASDTSDDGPVTLLQASREALESRAIQIVAAHALRSLDALHLAYAELVAAPLAERDELLHIRPRARRPRRSRRRAQSRPSGRAAAPFGCRVATGPTTVTGRCSAQTLAWVKLTGPFP